MHQTKEGDQRDGAERWLDRFLAHNGLQNEMHLTTFDETFETMQQPFALQWYSVIAASSIVETS